MVKYLLTPGHYTNISFLNFSIQIYSPLFVYYAPNVGDCFVLFFWHMAVGICASFFSLFVPTIALMISGTNVGQGDLIYNQCCSSY